MDGEKCKKPAEAIFNSPLLYNPLTLSSVQLSALRKWYRLGGGSLEASWRNAIVLNRKEVLASKERYLNIRRSFIHHILEMPHFNVILEL